jgi:ABC-2 type transport system ATP-binding protein
MDPESRSQTIELIRELGKMGKYILVSSHLLHEVEAMTSRILLLDRGRILASGEVLEVREAIQSRPMRIFLRCADARILGAELSGWPCVHSVSFSPDGRGLTVEVGEAGRFYRDLTALLSKRDLGIEIINPLDDNLAAVFEYLVK